MYLQKLKEVFFGFILGMISAFAFIPCNFPVLGPILSLISIKQNIVWGAIALFLFSSWPRYAANHIRYFRWFDSKVAKTRFVAYNYKKGF